MKKIFAILVTIFFSFNYLFCSEIPPIKVKDLQCSSLENNFKDKYKNEYWSITKNDTFAEKTFLSSDGFEMVVWKYDVTRDLNVIKFQRVDTYSPAGMEMIYRLTRKDGSMNFSFLGATTKFKCKPFDKKLNSLDFLKSRAEENLKKKKSEIKF